MILMQFKGGDRIYLFTILDKNVKNIHVVWLILEYIPTALFTQDTSPSPPKNNNIEVWPEHK